MVLNVNFADEEEIRGTIFIRDAVGRVCWQNYNVSQNSLQINVANYTSGVYFITFIDENNRKATKKFVKM